MSGSALAFRFAQINGRCTLAVSCQQPGPTPLEREVWRRVWAVPGDVIEYKATIRYNEVDGGAVVVVWEWDEVRTPGRFGPAAV